MPRGMATRRPYVRLRQAWIAFAVASLLFLVSFVAGFYLLFVGEVEVGAALFYGGMGIAFATGAFAWTIAADGLTAKTAELTDARFALIEERLATITELLTARRDEEDRPR